MRKSRFAEEQIVGILRLAEAGQKVITRGAGLAVLAEDRPDGPERPGG